jgi:hypothetical protein
MTGPEIEPPKAVGPRCDRCTNPIAADELVWVERPDGSLSLARLGGLDARLRAIKRRVWHHVCVAHEIERAFGAGKHAGHAVRAHDALHDLHEQLTALASYANLLERRCGSGSTRPGRAHGDELGEIDADFAQMQAAVKRAAAASRQLSAALQPANLT